MEKNIAKLTIHAGGGWEGHVVFTAINPSDDNDRAVASNFEEIVLFCKKRDLQIDDRFKRLIKENLFYSHKYGFVVPLEFIDEDKPITSCSNYLKKHFTEYY